MKEKEVKTTQWFKTTIFYEVSLKAFKDSTNNGMGDIKGLIQKLDYLQELGINCIWILPFYPSPWLDDGYDVSDFCDIHPAFGTISDFENLVYECKKRNIRIIGDLIINHSSDQHPWFKDAKKSKNSPKRDYYVWSDDNSKYENVRIIFLDTETSNWTFDPHSKQYFWHRFYSHQPDLNFESTELQEEMFKIIFFWLDKGLDGLRIDAVPYLFEEEATSCESLPKTHEFIKRIRKKIDERYGKGQKIILAEANQMVNETMPYFGNGNDEFHMAFHFPLMPRLFLALAKKNGDPIRKIILETSSIPDSCQWCTFLRNHDELTLEMVNKEVRDFMWNYFAPDPGMRLNLGIRRRLAPLLENDQKKIELLNSLLFSLPGSPIIYYGDEIGMGDNINLQDRNGVRTPMQWADTLNAGFSNASEDQLFLPVIKNELYGFRSVNVEKQQNDPNSLLTFYKKIIQKRNNLQVLAIGRIRFLETNHTGVLAYIRENDNSKLLLIHNLCDKSIEIKISKTDLRISKIEIIFPENLKKEIKILDSLIMQLNPYEYIWCKIRE